MTNITAVAKLYMKTPQAGSDQTVLAFHADYSDERNKDWSQFTPVMNVSMTVLNSVAENFELNENYIVTFEKQD